MILDNSRVHHAKLLEDFLLQNQDRLTLFFLPPYSPKLNLIEELWGWLKDTVINQAIPYIYLYERYFLINKLNKITAQSD